MLNNKGKHPICLIKVALTQLLYQHFVAYSNCRATALLVFALINTNVSDPTRVLILGLVRIPYHCAGIMLYTKIVCN